MPSQRLLANVEDIANILAALGNSKRLTIMAYLVENELSVGAIAEKVKLSQSALSQHLAKLRATNMVTTRRERQMIYYSCASPRVRQLLEMLATF